MRQCRLRRRLWVYRVGVMILRRRAVVSGWRSRLTSVAWVAPVALCALVTCGQQYSLAKVTSGSSAERTFVYRIECGRWASLPGEASWPCARAATCGHMAAPDPPGGVSVLSLLRGPDSMWGSGAPSCLALGAFFSGSRGDTGPASSGKRVRCRWSGEMEPDPRGPAAQLLRA